VPASLLAIAACATCSQLSPPNGARYQRTIRLPVIGRQSIYLEIESHNAAQLVMDGAIQIDAPVEYAVNEKIGAFRFALGPVIERILRRFRTSLSDWSADSDEAYVVVHPPLPVPVRVTVSLQRRADARGGRSSTRRNPPSG
jgi:hypothetical protein